MSFITKQQEDDEEEQPQQQQKQEEQGQRFSFAEDEVIFLENIFIELEQMIPNEQGENTEILEKIVLAERIIGSRLDPESAFIGDSE